MSKAFVFSLLEACGCTTLRGLPVSTPSVGERMGERILLAPGVACFVITWLRKEKDEKAKASVASVKWPVSASYSAPRTFWISAFVG